MIEFLKNHGVDDSLIDQLIYFRKYYGMENESASRIIEPKFKYFGRETWNMCIAALLEGNNLLISGPKATGKNVLAENLAYVFRRPSWTLSFHSGTDSFSLIGTDTFIDNQVVLRKGSIYECAENGGFGILDEINMAKNDAVAVLHATLDHRRIIDIPGYDKIFLHEATRFIGTMNYGYAGTRELNEALVSRFMVVHIPPMSNEKIQFILEDEFPSMSKYYIEQFSGLFMDLQLKAMNSEISTKSVDLRGLLGAIRSMKIGLNPHSALHMGIIGKTFDEFEQNIVSDVVRLRIPSNLAAEEIFSS